MTLLYVIPLALLSVPAFGILAMESFQQALNPRTAWKLLKVNFGGFAMAWGFGMVTSIVLGTLGALLCIVGIYPPRFRFQLPDDLDRTDFRRAGDGTQKTGLLATLKTRSDTANYKNSLCPSVFLCAICVQIAAKFLRILNTSNSRFVSMSGKENRAILEPRK